MPAYDEQEYTKSFDIKIWKRLGPYLRPRRGAFGLLIVLNLLTALVTRRCRSSRAGPWQSS